MLSSKPVRSLVRVVTLSVFFLVSYSLAWCQGSNTKYQRLINSATTATVTASLSATSNIGQSQHHAVVYLTAQMGHVCAAQNVDVVFRGSLENLTYFEIGPALTAIPADAAGNLIGFVDADGAYPYIQIQVLKYDNTNCAVTVDYFGTLYPNPAQVAVAPAYTTRGIRTVGINSVGMGPNTIFTNPLANRFVTIYGYLLYCDSATVLTFGKLNNIPMAAGEKLNVPNTGIAQFVLDRGTNLTLTSTMAATCGGSVVLRLEDNP